jgi:hypothetical protein
MLRITAAPYIAWSELRAHPGRAALTVVGLVVATTSLILITAAGTVARDANAAYVRRTFGLPATLHVTFGDDESTAQVRQVADVLSNVAHESGVRRFLRTETHPVTVIRGTTIDRNQSGLVVDSRYDQIRQTEIVAGRPFDRIDDLSLEPRAVVTESMANTLGPSSLAVVGQQVAIYPDPSESLDPKLSPATMAVVVGVMANPPANASGATAPQILLSPASVGAEAANSNNVGWLLQVAPRNVERVTALIGTASRDLGRPVVLQVDRIDTGGNVAPLIDQEQRLLTIVSIVALLIGGIGQLAVGLVSVRERRQEFGTLRAIGAGRGVLFLSVVLESMLAALGGAIASVIIAAIALRELSRYFSIQSVQLPGNAGLPWRAAGIGITAGIVTGLLAGVVPAIRAVRQQVITAIRA